MSRKNVFTWEGHWGRGGREKGGARNGKQENEDIPVQARAPCDERDAGGCAPIKHGSSVTEGRQRCRPSSSPLGALGSSCQHLLPAPGSLPGEGSPRLGPLLPQVHENHFLSVHCGHVGTAAVERSQGRQKYQGAWSKLLTLSTVSQAHCCLSEVVSGCQVKVTKGGQQLCSAED